MDLNESKGFEPREASIVLRGEREREKKGEVEVRGREERGQCIPRVFWRES